jgi:opacity protein-like surface antigen
MTKKLIKITLLLLSLASTTLTINAQAKGDLAVGANLTIGMGDDLTNLGSGVKIQYNATQSLRLEAASLYFLPKTQTGSIKIERRMWDLSANAHWLFPVAPKITIYPLAGLSLLGTSSSVQMSGLNYNSNNSDSDLGLNLGGGIDIKLVGGLMLNGEMKYRAGGTWNRLLLSAGVVYRF